MPCRGAGREKPDSLISNRVGLRLARDSLAVCLLDGRNPSGLLSLCSWPVRSWTRAGFRGQHRSAACDKMHGVLPVQGVRNAVELRISV